VGPISLEAEQKWVEKASTAEDEHNFIAVSYTHLRAHESLMNLVMNQQGGIIELQGTGEGRAFSDRELQTLLSLGRHGILGLMRTQRTALKNNCAHLLPLPRIAVATSNAHKLKELRELLQGICEPVGMRKLGFSDDIIEDGESFEANAKIKAETVMRFSGLPTLADDSGIAVAALGGAPGVHSARYAGPDCDDRANDALLLQNMETAADRSCKFVSALALAMPAAQTVTETGECHGTLLMAPRGENGFGYDHLFLYENGKTFAELTRKEKNTVSHRAKAAAAMRKQLEALFWL
jgi:XTP/dITP diphosphohydrolase